MTFFLSLGPCCLGRENSFSADEFEDGLVIVGAANDGFEVEVVLNLGLEASEETKVCMVCDEGTDEIVSGKVDQVEESVEETEAMEGD